MTDDDTTSAFDHSFTAIGGGPLPLSEFRSKTVLLVNTASCCGFTGQCAGLQNIWARYRDKGLIVLGVPSNDFANQEPKTEAEIEDFCRITFGIDFPMTAKVHVKGPDAHPFYRWAASELGALAKPRWNFHKYLIGPDGRLTDWFSTVTAPMAAKVTRAVEAQLARAETD